MTSLRAAHAAAPLPLAEIRGRHHRQGRAASSSRISNAGSASMRRCSARRWRTPSAPPTPRAPGTGRAPTTPARPRTVLFLRKFGRRMRARAGFARRAAADAGEDRRRCCRPTRAAPRRARRFQQFSTPIPLGFVARALRPRSRRPTVVLEPSAGTGLLAIFAELAGASLVLNELAETRAGLLCLSLPGHSPSRASTPPRSTTISMPASRPASC